MMEFEDFKTTYLLHLGSADQPSAQTAYESAEADHVVLFGKRRFKSWSVFRSACSHKRERQRKVNSAETLANR